MKSTKSVSRTMHESYDGKIREFWNVLIVYLEARVIQEDEEEIISPFSIGHSLSSGRLNRRLGMLRY